MTDTYSSDCHKMSASKSPPEKSTCESGEDSASQHGRTLWDITTPEEVAYSIIKLEKNPQKDFLRRQRNALKSKNKANIRFWEKVWEAMEAMGFNGQESS
ncbi:MAG: hypothetical protein COB54_06770 [Alphaproteobacteria bacterium]|nr:MAG: hypothetical protein COB54_06770 [Alphaproteobacteria bacterium]